MIKLSELKSSKTFRKVSSVIQSVAGASCVIMLVVFSAVAVALGANYGGDIPLGMAKTEHQVIVEMHKMANNYIIADEIWGKKEITKKRIAKLKDKIKGENMVNRGTLIAILERWEAGFFYTIDRDHNELLTMLGGTVGKATGVVTDDKLPAWHKGERSITDLNVLIQQKEAARKADTERYYKEHGTNILFVPTTQKAE